MMWGYYGNNPGMMVWGVLSSLFWLVLAAVMVWALVRWMTTRPLRQTPPMQMTSRQSPVDIVKMRYARGEIDTATYQAMREQLQEQATIADRSRAAMPSS